MTDEELIRLVASAKDSDPVPSYGGYSGGQAIKAMVNRLVEIGVMDEPSPVDMMIDVFHRAQAACAERLRKST